jgi:hypothetical protein
MCRDRAATGPADTPGASRVPCHAAVGILAIAIAAQFLKSGLS